MGGFRHNSGTVMSNTKVPGRNWNIQGRGEFDEGCKQLSSGMHKRFP
jgi:hypothetical protein